MGKLFKCRSLTQASVMWLLDSAFSGDQAAITLEERGEPMSKHSQLVLVESGTFQMGSRYGDSDAMPVHSVTVSSFQIGKYPVTMGEFSRFVKDSAYRTLAELSEGAYIWDGQKWKKEIAAYWRNPLYEQSSDHPVTCISWYDAVSFCNWLSEQDGLVPCYAIDKTRLDPNNHFVEDSVKWIVECDFSASGYRLPTEAEWEFAARGGNASGGFKYAGSNEPREVAWFIDHRAASGFTIRTRDFNRLFNTGTPRAIGKKKPNELGLHDMSGNVQEWCWDWYAEDYYHQSPRDDPKGPSTGSFRINRGGSWQVDMVNHLESAHRNYGGAAHVLTNFGFRISTLSEGMPNIDRKETVSVQNDLNFGTALSEGTPSMDRRETASLQDDLGTALSALSQGIPSMDRRMTSREKIGDMIFINLQILSRILFIISGLLGYYFYGIYGVFLLGIVGWVVGIWIRHSMGIRESDPTTGFYVRMQERAQGARRGVFEWLLEKIRGNEFSQSKCMKISDAYDQAMTELSQCTSLKEQKKIIEKLDRKVKEISYG